ncbi:MAG: metallophosphoesterase [Marmoricola sp.]
MPRLLAVFAAWVLVALPLWFGLFLSSHGSLVIASHDAEVTPTLDHYARITMGPYLPDLRQRTRSRIGVRVDLGKTRATSDRELIARYSLIASHPTAELDKVGAEVRELALTAAFRAGVLALVPIGAFYLLGARRREELFAHRPGRRTVAVVVTAAGLLALAVVAPWQPDSERVQQTDWIPLQQALPEVTVPAELDGVQVQGGLLTQGTRRLIASAFQGFDESKAFYSRVAGAAPAAAAQVRKATAGQTVALLISDRHDNIGMDDVARAIGDGVGATAVIDAGDDTSTGEPWEQFSLDSLDDAFSDYEHRLTVAGNHDNGSFASRFLAQHGWTHLDGTEATAFGVRFFGVDDPRSSGLGIWKDEKGLTFDQVRTRVGDELCARQDRGERISTLVVHDAQLGTTALERGCVDLVVAGHVHIQLGPDRVVGTNGRVGYTYTNGTTGGAAYAVAVGSRLRREAEMTVLTFEDGRPVGIQPIRINTRGTFLVDPYLPLDLGGS